MSVEKAFQKQLCLPFYFCVQSSCCDSAANITPVQPTTELQLLSMMHGALVTLFEVRSLQHTSFKIRIYQSTKLCPRYIRLCVYDPADHPKRIQSHGSTLSSRSIPAMASLRWSILIVAISLLSLAATILAQESIGINYGRIGNNLPPPDQVVRLLQSRSVRHVRIYDSDRTVLNAFANSDIDVGVSIPNNDVANIANNFAAADQWVQNNIVPYSSTRISTIAVGNEYLADRNLDKWKLLPAMRNIQQALQNRGLNSIKVSTPHSMAGLIGGPGFPPSAGIFSSDFSEVLRQMLQFLSEKNSVFMINIYPFFAYRDNHVDISLNYALGNPGTSPVGDSGSGLQYRNLFDAMVDTVISAMAKVGYGNVGVVITESGWPSGPNGEFAATVQNARSYNGNLVKHVLGNEGTPLRPGSGRIPTFIFALFNENQKGGNPTEQNFGLYYPNQSPVYNIPLSASLRLDVDSVVDSDDVEEGFEWGTAGMIATE